MKPVYLKKYMNRFRKTPGDRQPGGTLDGIMPPRRTPEKGVDALVQIHPRRQVGDFAQTEGYHQLPGTGRREGSYDTGPIDLPGAEQARPKRRVGRRIPWRAMRKWSLRSALVVVVIGLAIGGFLFVKGYDKLHKVFRGTKTSPALAAQNDPSALKTEGDGRLNILILGIGGPGHEAPDLTDTMLVASIDPVNHKVALLSVPRDLWVSLPHHGSMKINAAYETGKYAYLGKQSDSNSNVQAVEAGFASSDQIVSQVLGIPIQYNVLLNFHAFQQAVDTVGGVTINVPTELYDPTMAWENHGSPVLAKPGLQTFDGLHALFYVRSRETTSDFARTQRQRAMLVALEQKVFSLGTLSNPLKISQLLDAFGDNVVTDLSLSDLGKLYPLAKGIDPNSIQSLGLADPPNNYVTTGREGNQSVVIPAAGVGNYAAIQSYVRNALRDGYLAKENATVDVLNGTSHATAATNEASVLRSYGYTIGVVGDAPTHDYAKTVIVDLTNGKDIYTAHYLENRFGVKTTTKLPAGITPGTANFVVILGQS